MQVLREQMGRLPQWESHYGKEILLYHIVLIEAGKLGDGAFVLYRYTQGKTAGLGP